jgi:cell division protein FtsW (lipid II flippase)
LTVILISHPAADLVQRRLLSLAALFMALSTLALTLAPWVRQPSAALADWAAGVWQTPVSLLIWGASFAALNRLTARYLPHRDPYLLPAAALLSGWGLLIISRLDTSLGLRQAAWLGFGCLVVALGLRLPADLNFLRRYKYIWLTSGLLLTALTLLFGSNPLGYGPPLWLSCCGFYLQPSEPLKLLMLVYLSAYLADHPFLPSLAAPPASASRASGHSLVWFPLLAPTLVMTGLTLLLLFVQRDLGTASIFIFLYTVVVFLAAGQKRVLLTSLLTLAAGGLLAYRQFDVVQVRVDAWLNPWLDPSGSSYQIVQSLLAVANGGLLGRGPGLGSPGLVPIAHSDFIFSALAEEYGLAGSLVLLGVFALFTARGVITALRAPGPFRRLLAGGLSAYFAGQAVLIIGGNIRLLPLTGVTLPFVSYGGSSLVISLIGLLLLLKISNAGTQPAPLPNPRPYYYLAGLLAAGFAALALVNGWWSVYRAPNLLVRTDNARRAIADRSVLRGALLDRNEQPLSISTGEPGNIQRQSLHPPLSSILGYNHPVYGQSGLEASLDPFLRGTQGNPAWLTAWEHLRTGFSPPGLDVRLSLDLNTQAAADALLDGQKAALVLINAENGEILVMSSHPNFNPNTLEADWESLMQSKDAPFLNRATQAVFPLGSAAAPFLLAATLDSAQLPALPADLGTCTQLSEAAEPPTTWGTALAAGCSQAAAALGRTLGSEAVQAWYQAAGFFTLHQISLPVEAGLAAPAGSRAEETALGASLSPLNLATAAASISAQGSRPQPLLALDLRLPGEAWQSFNTYQPAESVFSPRAAQDTMRLLADPFHLAWHTVAVILPEEADQTAYTWFVGGSIPGWQGSPLALALVIEGNQPDLALRAGLQVLNTAMQP